MDRCEVCDLPFRTRRDIEDCMDSGFTLGELLLWVEGRFNLEIPEASMVRHRDHIFLADLYPFMTLKRGDPLTVEERKARIDAVFRPEVREAIYRMRLTREDDAQV